MAAHLYLLVISDREPLAWLVSEQRFALPASWAGRAPEAGDRLLLYTTRGCYRNPGRDRGLVMGTATVTTDPSDLSPPVQFRGREFTVGFGVRIDGLVRPHEGLELGPLAGAVSFLPDPATWSARMRRALVPLTQDDVQIIDRRLRPMLRPRDDLLENYLTACKVRAHPRETA